MKTIKLTAGFLMASSALILSSCGGGEAEDDGLQHVDTAATTSNEVIEEEIIDYAVPTPNELFEIVKLQGGEQKVGIVNPLENREKYIDHKSKCLNFGVYSADLAYMSCFGIGTEFLKYFSAIEELGEELGISGAFDEDLMDRIENNEGDSDSLFAISNDTYFDSYLYLEENEKGVELALIMAGGYVESLYIVTNLVDTYSEGDPIIEKIGDQKLVLENLLDFILEYSDDMMVSEIMDDLISLSDVFENSMEFEESGTSIDNNDDGTLILSGGGSFKMNEQAFTDIKAKAEELRNNIIN
ncbi:MAG: hypothetical protein MI810_13165 [Flavobacteriales bacterium]|nr:hypothetical protein [Flavobacteriales bacterium]